MQQQNFKTNRKTRFVSKYFYGKNVVDLEEFVISFATSCNLGCSYCYLTFVKTPIIPVVYTNKDLLFQELEDIIKIPKIPRYYFNCGETTDSLLTKTHIEIIEQMIDFLSILAKKYNKTLILELRTKTDNVKKMKEITTKNLKIVYATSLIPENIRQQIESKTSSTNDRIECLNIAINKNMFLGIRFEPIILWSLDTNDIDVVLKNLVKEYENLINIIYNKILDINKISSISLSAIRFTKQQFKLYLDKKSKLLWPEMVSCPDGKYRYSRPIRVEIYTKIIEMFKKYFGSSITKKIYLATEFDYIWHSCGLEIKKLVDFC
jgi:DNA repair photolyase